LLGNERRFVVVDGRLLVEGFLVALSGQMVFHWYNPTAGKISANSTAVISIGMEN